MEGQSSKVETSSSPSPPLPKDQRAPYETLAKSNSRVQLSSSQAELLQKGYFLLKSAREIKYVSRECKQLFESVGLKTIAKTDLSKSYKFLYEIMCALKCEKVFSDLPKIATYPSVSTTKFKMNRYLKIVKGLLDNWLLLDHGRIRTNVEVRQMALAIYSDILYLAGERINKYCFEFDSEWMNEYEESCLQRSIYFVNIKLSTEPKPKEEISYYPTTTILYAKDDIDIASHQDISKFVFKEPDGLPIVDDTDDGWKDCYLADLVQQPQPPTNNDSRKKLNPEDCDCKFNTFSSIANKFCPNCGEMDQLQYFLPSYANYLRNYSPNESK